MAIQISGKRLFKFKQKDKVIDLEDPNPVFTPEMVMDFYANHYPELVNGTVKGPELGKDDEIIYHLDFVPKTKG